MEAAFCAEKIEQRYGRRTVLKGCTVVAAHGECVGVAGRNGSGKSTLLGVLAGVRKPTSGTLRYEGRDLLKTGGRISDVVAYVPQTNPLIEELTAKENLQLLSGRHVREEEAVCERLQLGEFFRTKVRELSGGMKRRLAIACALADPKPVLIMDEPTSALDLHQKEIIYDYLTFYQEQGGIVVMATHEIEEMHFCDRLYLISGGTAEECLPESAVTRIKGE